MPMLPLNTALDAVAPAGGPPRAPVSLPPAPSAKDLCDWAQESYSLATSVAASLGFSVSSVHGSYSGRVLVLDSSRYVDIPQDVHTYRFGVALRVVVEVQDISGDVALTLPTLAAKIELENVHASSHLSVRGYKGDDLAALIPPWTSFGVDQYAGYMRAISEIQAKIMKNSDAIVPELLATTAHSLGDTASTSVSTAVALVYALDAIAHGLTAEDAMRRLPHLDDDVVRTVRKVYSDRVGADKRARPDAQQSEDAKKSIEGLRLRHGLFI